MAKRARRWWTSWVRENGRGRETAERGSERDPSRWSGSFASGVVAESAPLAAPRSVIRVGRDILFVRAGERLFDVHLPHGEGGRVGDCTAG